MTIDLTYQPRNFTTAGASQPTAQDIIKGKVISTAKIQLADRVLVIVVFNTSTYSMFFHTFEAKNMRAPRKTWKYTHQYHMIYGDGSSGGAGKFYTLESYAAQVCRLRHGSLIVIKRFFKKSLLAELFDKIAHPLKGYIQPAPLPGQTFFIASKITSGKQITKFDRAALTAATK